MGLSEDKGGGACDRTQWPGPGSEEDAQQCQTSAFLSLNASSGVCWVNDGGYCRQILILKGKSVNLRTMLLSEGHSPYSPSDQLDLA